MAFAYQNYPIFELRNTYSLTRTLTKISLFLVLSTLLVSCNAVKHLSDDELLLTKNTIVVDGEKISENDPYTLLTQTPNTRIPIVGIPLGLHIYNLAEPNPDSTYTAWLQRKPNREKRLINFLSKKQVDKLGKSKSGFNDWLKRTGSAPVIIDKKRSEKSIENLKRYYFTQGYFNVDGSYEIKKDSTKEKRGSITYNIERRKPYFVDSISEIISSPVIDSLYRLSKNQTFLIPGKQYNAADFENERSRLTLQLRNSGVYYFDQDYIGFDADTNDTGHKVIVDYIILTAE